MVLSHLPHPLFLVSTPTTVKADYRLSFPFFLSPSAALCGNCRGSLKASGCCDWKQSCWEQWGWTWTLQSQGLSHHNNKLNYVKSRCRAEKNFFLCGFVTTSGAFQITRAHVNLKVLICAALKHTGCQWRTWQHNNCGFVRQGGCMVISPATEKVTDVWEVFFRL